MGEGVTFGSSFLWRSWSGATAAAVALAGFGAEPSFAQGTRFRSRDGHPMVEVTLDRSLAQLIAEGWHIAAVSQSGPVFAYHLVQQGSFAICYLDLAAAARQLLPPTRAGSVTHAESVDRKVVGLTPRHLRLDLRRRAGAGPPHRPCQQPRSVVALHHPRVRLCRLRAEVADDGRRQVRGRDDVREVAVRVVRQRHRDRRVPQDA